MTSPVEERVEYTRDEFFQYYNDWCDWLDISLEDRSQSIQQFSKDLVKNCKVKEVDVKGTSGKNRHYVYRMYRKYDLELFTLQHEDKDIEDIDDLDIPDCGRYPRKR